LIVALQRFGALDVDQEKIMTENKLNGKLTEASWDMVKALQDVNIAMVDSAVETHERNMKYVQSMLLNGVEVFKSQVESSNGLMQEWITLFHKQQETFQELARASMEAYVGSLYRPLSYYKQTVEALEVASK